MTPEPTVAIVAFERGDIGGSIPTRRGHLGNPGIGRDVVGSVR
jgi:hypothetical protein